MSVNCLDRIMRTCRLESTSGANKRAYDKLIHAYQQYQYHFNQLFNRLDNFRHSRCVKRRISSLVIVCSCFLPNTTISMFGRSCCCRRKYSRITRRTRLRSCAFLICFLAKANPIRGWSNELGLASSRSSWEPERIGLLKTFWILKY